MLPTCAVSCTVHDQSGNPEVGAIITAKLSSYEVYQGYVVPETVSGTTNAQGVAVLNLWPSQLGSVESVYDITIKPQYGRSLRTTAIVPNQETAQLHLIAELPPYPGKTDGQLILDEAVAAGAVAVAKAEIATAQAEIATTKAEEASESAIQASDAAEKTDQALPILNEFVNKRYLGAKVSPPSLDNDGNQLEDGALYFNIPSNAMFVWGSGVWSMTTAASSADLANATDPAKGSALVGHMPSGTGAVARTVQSKLREAVSITDFYANGISGAKVDPTGVIDSTAGINAAFATSLNIIVPPGTYLIDPVDPSASNFGGGVKPQSNSTIHFLGGAKFVAKPNSEGGYVIINLRDTENVTIYDGNVVGDVGFHTGSTGEFGMGYYIASAVNPRLFNCKASKCWGDGFYVGYSIETSLTPTIGGVLSNCTADDNRRQGMSITSWSNGFVIGGEFKNTGKTAFTSPAYGIDIEPDDSGNDVIDVTLVGVRTSENKYGGIQFVPGFMSSNAYARPKYNVNLIGFVSYRDGDFNGTGIRFAYPDLSAAGVNVANRIYGEIQVNSPKIIECAGRAIDFARWIPTAPDVVINSPSIVDCNTSGTTINNRSQCGIVVYTDASDSELQTYTGKIKIHNPQIVDTRAAPKMLLPIWCEAGGATQYIDNVSITNPGGSGWSSGSNGLTWVNRASKFEVVFDAPPKKDLTGTMSLSNGAFAGYSIAGTVSGVITLPPANNTVGIEYIFENRYGVTLQIRPDAADTILNYGVWQGNDVVLRNLGDYIKLESIGSSKWEVVQAVGSCTPLGYSTPARVLYAGAAPTTRSWNRGDRVFNVSAAVGQPKSWVCTVSGTPGTWVSEGNL